MQKQQTGPGIQTLESRGQRQGDAKNATIFTATIRIANIIIQLNLSQEFLEENEHPQSRINAYCNCNLFFPFGYETIMNTNCQLKTIV